MTSGTLGLVAGCGGNAATRAELGPTPRPAVQDRSLLTPYGEPVPAAHDGGVADAAGGEVETMASPMASGSVAAGTVSAGDVPIAAPVPGVVAGGGAGAGGVDGGPVGLPQAALRAGFVDDNLDFDAYETYRDGYRGPSRDLPVTGRHVVTATDQDGMPLLGASVTIGKVTALSHVDGRALFFGVSPGEVVTITYDGASATGTVGSDLTTTIPVDTSRTSTGLTLDLNLVLDTTGSMSDEIERLNASLTEIATRLDALPSHPTVRYALTVYRDHADAYVFRSHDFTDLATFSAELATTTADGGGDTPEALDEAFHAAVEGPSWGQDDHSVEMLLLVSDAPSHIPGDADSDRGNQTPAGDSTYDQDAVNAQRRGIEVVPIAASGADDTAEYEFRQLAEYTLGDFFFLTYAPDGSPGDGTTNHVSGYRTGDLGDLIVDHVSDRLASYAVKAGTTPTPTPTPPNAN